MTQEKYDQLWNDLISRAIQDYLSKHGNYELAVSESKLKQNIYNSYEKEYKPLFKSEYMAKKEDDLESVDEVPHGGGIGIRIDRHKVAALLYMSIVGTDNKPFLKLKGKDTDGMLFSLSACHEIAYSVSLNCIHAFIEESHKQNPDCQHKSKFLNNSGFSKSPNLICEKYASYRESIIPRMVWAIGLSHDKPERMVRVNVNILANIFYFLELHSAS
jgi:hypothetical protein